MVSSYTTAKNLEKPAAGDYANTWATPVNANYDLIDSALGGTLSLTLGSSNVTLTRSQAANLIVACTGTLTANVQITFPAYGGFFIVDNRTTGSFTVTIACAGGGSTVTATQSARTIIMTDGTNARIADDRVSVNSAALDGVLGSTRGAVAYRGASGWTSLAPGTSGYLLQTNGAGADPSWVVAPSGGGGGGVSSVTAGDGLNGGGTGAVTIAANSPVRVWGCIASTGAINASYGLTSCSKSATGSYALTGDFGGGNQPVTASASAGVNNVNATATTGSATTCTVKTTVTTTAALADAQFSFIHFH